jgi:hypothetical protein
MVALAAFCAWAGHRLRGEAGDDAFITYRYAQNLAAGNGLVFNPGARVFGCTEPLLAVALAGAHRLTGVAIPTLGTVWTAVVLWGLGCVLLWRLEGPGSNSLGPSLAAIAVTTSSFLWAQQGYAALAGLLLLSVAALLPAKRPLVAGVLAAIAVGLRPDNALGLVLLGAMRGRGNRSWFIRYGATAIGGVGVLVLLAYRWFGTSLPETLGTKRDAAEAFARMASRSGLGFWPAAQDAFARHFGLPLWAVAAAALVGWLALAVAPRRTLGLGAFWACFALSLAAAYPLLRVGFWPWYASIPVAAGLAGLGALAGGSIVELTGVTRSRRWVAGCLLAFALLPTVPIQRASWTQWRHSEQRGGRALVYRELGTWLRVNTSAEARVAALEVGALAYWSERPVIDLMGLVSRETRPFLASEDLFGAIRDLRPELVVVLAKGRLADLPGRTWFASDYALAARFAASTAHETHLYARQPRLH